MWTPTASTETTSTSTQSLLHRLCRPYPYSKHRHHHRQQPRCHRHHLELNRGMRYHPGRRASEMPPYQELQVPEAPSQQSEATGSLQPQATEPQPPQPTQAEPRRLKFAEQQGRVDWSETPMHRRLAGENLPTQYGPARNTRDAGRHELDEFTEAWNWTVGW